MALRFPCPTCNRELSGPESIVGREVQCPACQTVFLAGEQRGSGVTGITSEGNPFATAPKIKNPYRSQAPDEDYPLRRANPPEGRKSSWYALLALLVFAPLACCGIVIGMLMGSQGVTSAPPARKMNTVTTAKDDDFNRDKK